MNDAARPTFQIETHRDILRLKSLNSLAYIAVIDVAAVNLHKIMEGGTLISGGLVSASEFVVQSHAGFPVKRRERQSAFIPAQCGIGNSLVQEALRKPSVSLQYLWKWMTVLHCLANFL
jgi:hypothetical protein